MRASSSWTSDTVGDTDGPKMLRMWFSFDAALAVIGCGDGGSTEDPGDGVGGGAGRPRDGGAVALLESRSTGAMRFLSLFL